MIPDVATDIIVQIIKNIIDNISKTDENKNIYKSCSACPEDQLEPFKILKF